MFAKNYTSIVFTKTNVRVFDIVRRSGRLLFENQISLEGAETVEGCLKLLENYRPKNNNVYFSLPDTLSKVTIEANDPSLDNKSAEFVKWKAAKNLFLNTGDYAFDFYKLSPDKSLGVFIKNSTIEKIQDYARRSKIKIQKINIHSFNILGTLQIDSENNGSSAFYALILVLKDYVATLFFRENVLDFYRCKMMRSSPENSLDDINHSINYFLTRHPESVLENIYTIDPEKYLEQELRSKIGKVTALRTDSILDFSSAFKYDPSDILYYLSAAGAIM